MHKNNKKFVVIVLLLMITILAGGCGSSEEEVIESELTVRAAAAQVQNIAKTSLYSGTVRGINEVYVTSKVPARVTAIYAQAGNHVNQGDLLLTLDSSDYEAGIQQAQAAVNLAEAAKKANDIQKESALTNYERISKLYESGAVSIAELEAAQAQYDILNSGSAEAAVEQAQAALLQAQTSIGYCSITAPISGTVGTIDLSLGETASTMSPAVIISDTSRLEIEVMVSESEISYIQKGSEVEVAVNAVRSEPFTGTVDSVSAAADPTTRNYHVKVTMDNPDNLIKSGMFAQVAVSTVSADDALCVPRNAVIPKGSKSVVYIVDEESRARMAEVTVGIENNSYIQILGGLTEGQQVIEKGNTLVEDGSRVRVVTGGEN